MKKELLSKSFINASGVFIYMSLIAMFFRNTEKIFGNTPEFFAPIFMLLLFVISATITGYLVLGKPIFLYMDGFKKDSILLLSYTIGWMILLLFVLAMIMVLV